MLSSQFAKRMSLLICTWYIFLSTCSPSLCCKTLLQLVSAVWLHIKLFCLLHVTRKARPQQSHLSILMLLLNNADVCNLHMHATLSPAITSCSMHSCKDTRRSKTDNLHCTPLPYAVLNAVQTAVQPPIAGDTMLSFLSLHLSQSCTST